MRLPQLCRAIESPPSYNTIPPSIPPRPPPHLYFICFLTFQSPRFLKHAPHCCESVQRREPYIRSHNQYPRPFGRVHGELTGTWLRIGSWIKNAYQWAQPDSFSAIPQHVRDEMVEGMLEEVCTLCLCVLLRSRSLSHSQLSLFVDPRASFVSVLPRPH